VSLAYIRDYYGVPARRGGRVRFDGRDGTIVGAQAQYLRVRLDGDRRPITAHAKWRMEYAEQHSGER